MISKHCSIAFLVIIQILVLRTSSVVLYEDPPAIVEVVKDAIILAQNGGAEIYR